MIGRRNRRVPSDRKQGQERKLILFAFHLVDHVSSGLLAIKRSTAKADKRFKGRGNERKERRMSSWGGSSPFYHSIRVYARLVDPKLDRRHWTKSTHIRQLLVSKLARPLIPLWRHQADRVRCKKLLQDVDTANPRQLDILSSRHLRHGSTSLETSNRLLWDDVL
jgi:hypothetical protein